LRNNLWRPGLARKDREIRLGRKPSPRGFRSLRRAESTCEEVLSDLERPSGNLLGFQEDIGPEQAAELRRLVSRLREEIRRIEGEMLLDVSVQSRARCVAGSVSLTRVEIRGSADTWAPWVRNTAFRSGSGTGRKIPSAACISGNDERGRGASRLTRRSMKLHEYHARSLKATRSRADEAIHRIDRLLSEAAI
jgi:hypothetical protein